MIKKEIMMIKKLVIIAYVGLFFIMHIQASPINDNDFDGVPDNLDKCQNTPFLNMVDKDGCTTNILILPFETEAKNIITTIGYGYSTNEDLMSRVTQNNTKLRVSYYQNTWSFTLQGGYYTDGVDRGSLDTVLRVQKRIRLKTNMALNLGAGLRLPTYDYDGNKHDILAYTSLHYYPTSSLSLFGGYNFTKIGDEAIGPIIIDGFTNQVANDNDEGETFEGIQDKHRLYIGTGYFFADNFYINFVYSIEQSKFVGEHYIQELSSTLYYKFNKHWFATFYYKREPFDDDLHENLLFSVGYSIW